MREIAINGFRLRAMDGTVRDAFYINRVAPTVMIFLPCEGSVSDNGTESATPQDLAAGCDVPSCAILSAAKA